MSSSTPTYYAFHEIEDGEEVKVALDNTSELGRGRAGRVVPAWEYDSDGATTEVAVKIATPPASNATGKAAQAAMDLVHAKAAHEAAVGKVLAQHYGRRAAHLVSALHVHYDAQRRPNMLVLPKVNGCCTFARYQQLRNRLGTKRITRNEGRMIFVSIVSSLALLHAIGVTHTLGDTLPGNSEPEVMHDENVWIDSRGLVYLGDYARATLPSTDSQSGAFAAGLRCDVRAMVAMLKRCDVGLRDALDAQSNKKLKQAWIVGHNNKSAQEQQETMNAINLYNQIEGWLSTGVDLRHATTWVLASAYCQGAVLWPLPAVAIPAGNVTSASFTQTLQAWANSYPGHLSKPASLTAQRYM